MGIKQFGGSLSPYVRRSAPEPVFRALQGGWRRLVAALDGASEARLKASYRLHVLGGGTFMSWYGRTLNQWAEESRWKDLNTARNDKFLMESGLDDLALLKQHGLVPTNTILEHGCGWLRAGSHIIRYLEPKKYTGVDPAGSRIRIGREVFDINSLKEKLPNLIEITDNTFDWLEGNAVDYIWSHAVIGHLPKDDLEFVFANVTKVMHTDTKFMFTFDNIADGRDEDPTAIVAMDARNWHHATAYMKALCERHGMEVEFWQNISDDLPSFNDKESLGVARLAQ